jgi:hypothetical protein
MINTLLILALTACGGGCRDRHDDDSKVPVASGTDTSVGTSTAR